MASKRIDALKAKQKKQKIVAVVLGVVFLAVMGFQVPRVMKMMKTPPDPHASDTTATTAAPPAGTPSLAAPSLSGAAPISSTPTDPAAASDTAAALNGQLASFSRFASKDPFSQQLSDDNSSSSSGGSSGGSASGGGGTPTVPKGPSSSPRPGTAVISVNGTLYTVAVSSDFPQSTPLFHLVSVTSTSARISIVGGSYSSGAATVTLKVNKPVTLMNTADGTRYTLVLRPLGTSVPSSGSGSSGSGGSAPTTSTTSTTVTLPSP
jgi:uncharacterized membrane protein YgcG